MHSPSVKVLRCSSNKDDGSSSTNSLGEVSLIDTIRSFRATYPTLINERTFTDTLPSRLIFIGDIHGCSKEFSELLEKVEFKQGVDQVILVGDLVAKGSDSLGVVNKARLINAWGVCGNHEDQVLRWYEFLQGPGKGLSEEDIKALENSDDLPYDDFKFNSGHYDIASTMSSCDFSYLAQFPTIMALPDPYSEWVVTHGGMDPSKAILAQDPKDVMSMRNIGPDGPFSKADGGDAWFEVWADKIGPLSRNSVSTSSQDTASLHEIQFKKVIYGHDATRGLQIHNTTKGLDSCCVYGGELTAFILPGEQIVQVPCKGYAAKTPLAKAGTCA